MYRCARTGIAFQCAGTEVAHQGCGDGAGATTHIPGAQATVAAVVKLVVAFLLVSQAAFRVFFDSLFGAVFGFKCTSSIGFQLRVKPDQRLGLALRAAA